MKPIIECNAKSGEHLEKKHKQIAQAAAPLFIEKGFHQTSMREISKAVGMSMGNLYHYIKSKDDVLFLVYQELFSIWTAGLEKLEIEKIKGPKKKLTALIKNMMQSGYKYKKLTQMTFRETKFLEKSALKKILSIESKFIETMVEVVRYGIKQGVFRKDIDPLIIGNLIAHNTFFYPLRSWYFKKQVSYEDVEKHVVAFFVKRCFKEAAEKIIKEFNL